MTSNIDTFFKTSEDVCWSYLTLEMPTTALEVVQVALKALSYLLIIPPLTAAITLGVSILWNRGTLVSIPDGQTEKAASVGEKQLSQNETQNGKNLSLYEMIKADKKLGKTLTKLSDETSVWIARNEKRSEQGIGVLVKIYDKPDDDIRQILQQSIDSLEFRSTQVKLDRTFSEHPVLNKITIRIGYNGRLDQFVIGIQGFYRGQKPDTLSDKDNVEYMIHKVSGKPYSQTQNLTVHATYQMKQRFMYTNDPFDQVIEDDAFSDLSVSKDSEVDFLCSNNTSAILIKPGEQIVIEFPQMWKIPAVPIQIDFK